VRAVEIAESLTCLDFNDHRGAYPADNVAVRPVQNLCEKFAGLICPVLL